MYLMDKNKYRFKPKHITCCENCVEVKFTDSKPHDGKKVLFCRCKKRPNWSGWWTDDNCTKDEALSCSMFKFKQGMGI